MVCFINRSTYLVYIVSSLQYTFLSLFYWCLQTYKINCITCVSFTCLKRIQSFTSYINTSLGMGVVWDVSCYFWGRGEVAHKLLSVKMRGNLHFWYLTGWSCLLVPKGLRKTIIYPKYTVRKLCLSFHHFNNFIHLYQYSLNPPRTEKTNCCVIWILKALQDICKNAIGCSPADVCIRFLPSRVTAGWRNVW
jgi:hypothetical protein